MKTVTLKEYALRHQISYEAVRRQVRRHEKELLPHMIRNGRQRLLDEWAVEYLDQHRRENPVMSVRQDQLEEIQQQNERIDSLMQKIIALTEENAMLHKQSAELIEAKIRNEVLLEDKERMQAEIRKLTEDAAECRAEANTAKAAAEVARASLDQLQKDLETAKAAAESYQRTVFGLYRKRKQ